jgi:flavin-dependent dehydrogenase
LQDDSEYNNSISRAGLNKFLMTQAEKAGATINFDHRFQSVDFDKSE